MGRRLTFGLIFKLAIAFWWLSYVYQCTPHRWTSFERVWKETAWRILYPFCVLVAPHATVDGTLFTMDPKTMLPIEPGPPVVYLPSDTPDEVALQTMIAANQNQDHLVVWKNFTKGRLDHWRNIDYAWKALRDTDEYDFLVNKSNYHVERMKLADAKPRMNDLYLGFSFELLANNEQTLLKDFKDLLSMYGPDFEKLVAVNKSQPQAWLYQGKEYHTGIHQAPISDWFFMISNGKTWRFVEPKYTPYMGAFTLDGIATMSKYDYLSGLENIPYTDVATEPGDFMFFPAHWWHEVHNNYDNDVGIGFGFRPYADALDAVLSVLFPIRAKKAVAVHRVAFFTGLIKRALLRIQMTYEKGNSGLVGRQRMLCGIVDKMQQHVPTWTWNRRTGGPTSCHPGAPPAKWIKTHDEL